MSRKDLVKKPTRPIIHALVALAGASGVLTLLAAAPITPEVQAGIASVESPSCPVFSAGRTIHNGKGQLFITEVFFVEADDCDWTGGANDFKAYLRDFVPDEMKAHTFSTSRYDGFGSAREAEQARQAYMEKYHLYEIHHVPDYPPAD